MKEQIKDWLRAKNHEREWLAEKLSVNKRTVDNWLSSPKPIPAAKLTMIQRLMEDDDAAEAQRRIQLLPQAQIFSLEVDLPTFRAFSAAALAAGKTLEQWSIDSLNELADEYKRTGLMPDIRETKSTVAGVPVRILEPAGSKEAALSVAPFVGAGLSTPVGGAAAVAAAIAAAMAKAKPELATDSPSKHRDVSPESIKLNDAPSTEPLLMDFGIREHKPKKPR